jgi:GTP-binding protein
MKILSAEFIRSVFALKDLPKDHRPQIAFAGRSNVGKSSLLNLLLNRKKLAHVSGTPGKTQSLNFYLINDSFYFVDLPGYGYARAPKSLKDDWQGLIESYLSETAALRLVVSLVDLRHAVSPLDVELWEWLVANNRTFAVVGTKADKIGAAERSRQAKSLAAESARYGQGELVAFSAQTGLGKDLLWRQIAHVL